MFFSKSKKKTKAKVKTSSAPGEARAFTRSMEDNSREILSQLGNNLDFDSRNLIFLGRTAKLFYFGNLIDTKKLSDVVVLPLQSHVHPEELTENFPFLAFIREHFASLVAETEEVKEIPEAIAGLIQGKALLIIEGEAGGLLFSVDKSEKRNIAAPESEQSVIGPKVSFIEDVRTNLAIIRKYFQDPQLKAEAIMIGERSRWQVAVLYISDIANPQLVQRVKERLHSLEIDGLHGHVNIEELIEENSFSLFPQMRASERPDVVCGYLMEGHVGILAPNTDHVLIVPMTFLQLLNTVDDYYSHWQYATLIRLIRGVSMMLSIAIPGLYLSLVAYNPELIPTRLVISMDAARAKVALPIILEILIMEIIIEILREAGLKLPKPIGQAVSIIGGLVIGEAAVNANLVSPVTVVIVALTAISSFTAPLYTLGITYRILRFFLLLCSTVLGLYGFLLGLFMIHAHLAKLSSFGVPYLAPLSPFNLKDWRDILFRFPFKKMVNRPSFLKALQQSKGKSLPMKRGTWDEEN